MFPLRYTEAMDGDLAAAERRPDPALRGRFFLPARGDVAAAFHGVCE
jgi:hypothetical protein